MIGFQPDPPPRRVLLGRLVITPAAADEFEGAGETPVPYIKRHARGDWGDLDADDRAANDRALLEGTRLLSEYRLSTGKKIWIITEADRSVTTVLTPACY